MAFETIYDFNPVSPVAISREPYNNVGSGVNFVGEAARGFKESTFEIWDSDVGGTKLTLNADYEILNLDTRATALTSTDPDLRYNVYTRYRILNTAYQTVNIYITYDAVKSYNTATFTNNTRTLISAIGGISVETLTNADDPYIIADSETFTDYDCDTTAGNINITLPTLSDNYGKFFRITHNIQGSTNYVEIFPEGADQFTQDSLTSIELAKEGDHIELFASQQAGAWIIRNERISCQLRLNTFAGYGSTDNKIMQFTNITENFGNCFSDNHGSYGTAGLEITITKSGKYDVSFSCMASGGSLQVFSLSLNSTQLTTSPQSINVNDRLILGQCTISFRQAVSIELYFSAGDVIRPHTSGITPSDAPSCLFSVTYGGN